MQPLPREFYAPSAQEVAPALLGQLLLRRTPDGICGGAIVETEAYLCDDPACHAYLRQTPRNRAMWGREGRAYIYLIYGYHICFNAVCRPAGIAEAVLVRALEPNFGQEWMRKQRSVAGTRALTSGPAKLCAALQINRSLDGVDLCAADSPLWIARNPDAEIFRKQNGPLVTTTRIGLSRAADWPLRFYLGGSEWVSRRERRRKA